MCTPTILSFLRGNAFRPEENGEPGKGEVDDITTEALEEPGVKEEEQLLGFQCGDIATPRTTDAQCTMRLGRALDGNTMRRLGVFLHASQT